MMEATTVRGWDLAERVARAVLYEGYILYPYRPSAVKNRQRWTFGGVYPRQYSLAQHETDPWWMQTECLALGDVASGLHASVHFLQLQERTVHAVRQASNGDTFQSVPLLRAAGKTHYAWQEGVERAVALPTRSLGELAATPLSMTFSFPAEERAEPLYESDGRLVGKLIWQQQAIEGKIEVTAHPCSAGTWKIAVRILNETPLATAALSRDEAVLRACVSTHTLLRLAGGEFVSLLEPPAALQDLAAACDNVGAWPVLVGELGQHDLLLSSPIILYDYPQLAPESAGDLFDGTEIDEILTLRILTLTDEEKEEVRQADDRGRELLDRTEALPAEVLARLHGAIRGLRPLSEAG